MKKVILFLVAMIFCFSFVACDKDEDDTNLVRYHVSLSDPTASAGIVGHTGQSDDYLTIYDGWEYEELTDAKTRDVSVSSRDREVVVTLKVYINNKLKIVEQHKGGVHAYVTIRE